MRLCRSYFDRIPAKNDIYANFLNKKDQQINSS